MRLFSFHADFVTKYDLLLFGSIYLISMCVLDSMIINSLDTLLSCMALAKKKNILCISYSH